MRRRKFIALLGASALTWPLEPRAQPAMPVVGFLCSGIGGVYKNAMAAFHQGLKQAGYIEKQNVAIENAWANNEVEQLPVLAADLVYRQVAAIFAVGPPAALAAKAATTTIPVVVAMGSDPVKLGLATSLNRPGGNVTGATFITTDLVTKRLELLCELVPQAKTVAYLNPSPRHSFPATEQMTSEFLAAARTLGRQVVVLQADSDRDLEAIFEALVERHAGALVIASSLLFDSHDEKLAALALRHSIPAIYQRREFVEAGGLMCYSGKWADAFHAAGLYAGRILKGEKAAELPFQQSNTFEVAINTKTAKALGLSISRSLLDRVDEVIE
jgi:putative tryptophan/tyrosine transport system substrate-binding protein